MDFRIFTEPQQGATYDDLLRVAKVTEDAGYDAFFRSDHYLVMGGGDGLPGPTDAWTTLAALGRETSRIKLGTLMTSATFRYPGVLAIQVAGADQMSGGRIELGIGAGWYEEEHTAYGIPFPPVKERFDRLEEQLEILTGMWGTPAGEKFSFSGQHYTVVDSPALPKPVQARLPILIGGGGPKRTPALAGKYADEFNMPFASVEDTEKQFGRVRDLVYSNALVLCCGRDEAEVKRRADVIGRDVDELRRNGAAGTPAEVVDTLGRYAEIGCERVYLQVLDLADLDHLELVASEVVANLR
jgi:F420-dependent oxidoreductase-like protein